MGTPDCHSLRIFSIELVSVSRKGFPRSLVGGGRGRLVWLGVSLLSKQNFSVFCTAPHPCPQLCLVSPSPEPVYFNLIFCWDAERYLAALGHGRISGGLNSSFYRLLTNPPSFTCTSQPCRQQYLMPPIPHTFWEEGGIYGENRLTLIGFPVQSLILQPCLLSQLPSALHFPKIG